jgi:4-aminobutyrate aminotransferase / (S)-3-amino-2-methylpropionate transaminase / 5-aminovalerate transaminase
MPIGDIRGLGAMCAFEMVTEHCGNKPEEGSAKALAAKRLECGLLILTCGVYGDVVNLLTPLMTSEMIMKDGLDILEAAIVGNSGERNS